MMGLKLHVFLSLISYNFHIFLTFWLFNAFFPGNTLLFFLFKILQSQDFFHIMPWEEYQVHLQSNPPKVTCFAQKEHLYGGQRKRNFSKIFFTCGGHPTKLMFCSTLLVLVYPCWCVLTRTHICLPLLKFENRCALVCNWFALAVQMVVLFFISKINFWLENLKLVQFFVSLLKLAAWRALSVGRSVFTPADSDDYFCPKKE